MTQQKAGRCSQTIYHSGGGWGGTPCSKTATVERDNRFYCTFHDPQRMREREAKHISSKCYHREAYERRCTAPAVEVDSVGYGRCPRHTVAILAARARLLAAAPDLLAAAKALYRNMGEPQTAEWAGLVAAIAKAEGR